MAVNKSTASKLYAAAHGECAFPGCNNPIFNYQHQSLVSEICHIRSKTVKGPRYDRNYPTNQLDKFDNLVILCNNNHKTVDDDIGHFTIERLLEMKKRHESSGAPSREIDENAINLLIEKSNKIENSKVGDVFNINPERVRDININYTQNEPASNHVYNTDKNVRDPEDDSKSDDEFVYCTRCGALAGERSVCTGIYTNHNFIEK